MNNTCPSATAAAAAQAQGGLFRLISAPGARRTAPSPAAANDPPPAVVLSLDQQLLLQQQQHLQEVARGQQQLIAIQQQTAGIGGRQAIHSTISAPELPTSATARHPAQELFPLLRHQQEAAGRRLFVSPSGNIEARSSPVASNPPLRQEQQNAEETSEKAKDAEADDKKRPPPALQDAAPAVIPLADPCSISQQQLQLQHQQIAAIPQYTLSPPPSNNAAQQFAVFQQVAGGGLQLVPVQMVAAPAPQPAQLISTGIGLAIVRHQNPAATILTTAAAAPPPAGLQLIYAAPPPAQQHLITTLGSNNHSALAPAAGERALILQQQNTPFLAQAAATAPPLQPAGQFIVAESSPGNGAKDSKPLLQEPSAAGPKDPEASLEQQPQQALPTFSAAADSECHEGRETANPMLARYRLLRAMAGTSSTGAGGEGSTDKVPLAAGGRTAGTQKALGEGESAAESALGNAHRSRNNQGALILAAAAVAGLPQRLVGGSAAVAAASLPVRASSSSLDRTAEIPKRPCPEPVIQLPHHLKRARISTSGAPPPQHEAAELPPGVAVRAAAVERISAGSQGVIGNVKISRAEKGGCQIRPHQAELWEKMYNELAIYKKTHGHCSVPNVYTENMTLARWVKRQRYQYKLLKQGKPGKGAASSMTPQRIRALEKLGFVWDFQSATWSDYLRQLVDFKTEYGHCNVPISYSRNPGLATWVKCQRRQYRYMMTGKPNHMSKQRIVELENVGFEFQLRGTVASSCGDSNTTASVGQP